MMLLSLLQTVRIWLTASVFGIIVVISLLKDAFTNGFGKVFTFKVPARPSCLDDPALGMHGYLHLENVRIHYVASGPEDKPLMLFIHGFPEFWYSWRSQIKEFQKSYRVVAIDQRGFAGSDKPKGIDAYTVKLLITDVKQVIQALGYHNCILVAHDWGASVAWSFAAHFPDLVNKLIIMNGPPLPVFQSFLRKDSAQKKMSWYVSFYQLPCLPEFSFRCRNYGVFDRLFSSFGMAKEDIDAYKYTFAQPDAITCPMNYYRAVVRRPKETALHDMNYSMPVLVIWGDKDLAISSKIPDTIQECNASISVKRIPEAGHFVQMEAPDAVNAAMKEWLSDLD